MGNIGDILANNNLRAQEPEEFQIIRDFCQQKIGVKPALSMQGQQILITIRGSAAAGNLQLELLNLEELLPKDTKLRIRVG